MKGLTPVYSNERRGFAFEMKFLLPATTGEVVLAWARQQLCPDPHVKESSHGTYQVNSLYFDAPKLEVYHRVGSYARSKYRVRRYGGEKTIFLERKLKTKGQVGKRRTRIPDEELPLLNQDLPLRAWPGYWFHRRLLARQLTARCQITYKRAALVGMGNEGAIRLTLDRDILCFPTRDLSIQDTAAAWTPILANQSILELKFPITMPGLFKSLIQELGLTPQPVSKYRLSVQAFGWDPALGANPSVSGNGHVTGPGLTPDHPSGGTSSLESGGRQ
jgi:hypothetical protein